VLSAALRVGMRAICTTPAIYPSPILLYFQFVDCPPARSVQFLIENEIEFHFHNWTLTLCSLP
jgi:hypothetical protein